MEHISAEKKVSVESISDESLDRLRGMFDDAISFETAAERVTALEALIAKCAGPLEALESGSTLSSDYGAFLEALTKMHMLETLHAKAERLFHPVS